MTLCDLGTFRTKLFNRSNYESPLLNVEKAFYFLYLKCSLNLEKAKFRKGNFFNKKSLLTNTNFSRLDKILTKNLMKTKRF